MAKEAGNISTAGNNRACSDRESRKNRCGDGMLSTESRDCPKEPLYHECEQEREKELLQLW